jgi:hypothetical protein
MSAAPIDPVESSIVRDEAANYAGALSAEEAVDTIRWPRPSPPSKPPAAPAAWTTEAGWGKVEP